MAITAATLLLTMSSLSFAVGPSFNCENARADVERLICADPEASELDRNLSEVYASYSKAVPIPELKSEQQTWLKQRNLCPDVNCLKASYRKRIDAFGSISLADKSPSPAEICTHLLHQFNVVHKDNQPLGAGTYHEKILCFPDNKNSCQPSDKYHPADLFFKSNNLSDTKAIQDELHQYENTNSYVSELDINGDGFPEVRIARTIGTARCVRDTYLKRIGGSYSLIHTPSLDSLSEEAGNCGSGEIFFSRYKNKSYAAEVFYRNLAVYQIEPDFNLNVVCKLPHIMAE